MIFHWNDLNHPSSMSNQIDDEQQQQEENDENQQMNRRISSSKVMDNFIYFLNFIIIQKKNDNFNLLP